jgi:predicted ester cyclase
MSAEQNKALVRRVYQELFAGNLAIADETVAPEYVCHHGTGIELHGPKGLKQLLAENLQAFSEFEVTIDDQVAEGDKVVTRFSLTGSHTGAFRGIPPSGNELDAWFIVIDQIVDGKVIESWQRYDTLRMMQQLGALPEGSFRGGG